MTFQNFLEGYDEKSDRYIPTKEEIEKFIRIDKNYSSFSKDKERVKKHLNKKDLKDTLKELSKITKTLESDASKKRFYDTWYSCWNIENDNPEEAIERIKKDLYKYPSKDKNKILKAIENLKKD